MSISSVSRCWALRFALVLGVHLGAGCASAPTPAPAPVPEGPKPAAASHEDAPDWCQVPPSPSSGCGHPSSAAGALLARAGDLETPYLLTLPNGYDGTQPVPLVFAFHGRSRTHQLFHDVDASHLAEQLGPRYAVAYVKSVGAGFDEPEERSDNLQIFDALYAQLLATYCIDTEQVFAIGHSSGAQFSEILACERSSALRGIAAVAGALVLPECLGRTAALMVHGERDSVVSVSRGGQAVFHFMRANGCARNASPVGTAGCMRFEDCRHDLPVEWCEHGEPTYENTNHGWPSFASAEIARFLGGLGRVPRLPGRSRIQNGSFDTTSEPWQVSFAGSAKGTSSVKNGALCVTLETRSPNPWDAQVLYSGLKLTPAYGYVIDFRLWTSPPSDVRVRLGLDAAPFSEYWVKTMAATREPQRVTDDTFFLSEPTPGTLALAFQFAGPYARELPVTLCIDEVDITADSPR